MNVTENSIMNVTEMLRNWKLYHECLYWNVIENSIMNDTENSIMNVTEM